MNAEETLVQIMHRLQRDLSYENLARVAEEMNYWLLKSEPGIYSITDLECDHQTIWDGVRNYQAHNFLRQMQQGDLAFFYYSSATPSGIAGLMRVVASGVADPTQFDPDSPYYDPKSSPNSPWWQKVKVEFVEAFPDLISLTTLKQEFSEQELWVTRRGN